jgi:hypothetical protein
LSAAEKALTGLETGIPKARMEAAAQRAKADDLGARLDSLRAATQVSSYSCFLWIWTCQWLSA